MIELGVLSFSLVLARVSMFVAMLPLFGGRGVPRLIKVGLAAALSLAWFGEVEPIGAAELLDPTGRTHWLAFGVAMVREALLGAVLGQAFALFLVPAQIAGEFIGQEMGLALAQISDPSMEGSGTIVGQVFEMFAVLVFFGLDAHHLMLVGLHSTFLNWPIGAAPGTLPIAGLVEGVESAHRWGLLIAAPVGACLFVSTVVLALMSRAAPQLNILSVGFTLKLGVGLGGLLLLLPDMLRLFGAVFGHFQGFVQSLV